MGFPSKFGRLVSIVLLVIGAIPLLIMMAVVVANSVGRAIFNKPVAGTIEIAGLAGAIVVAAAVGFTARERGNVAVDVLMTRLKPRVRAVFDVATYFLSLAGVSFLLYAVIRDAFKSVRMGDITITMAISTAPFKFAWAAGLFILACFLVVHITGSIRKRSEG
jgi:TRAP-type transport system small permease protein